jgi:hypothetical protein
MQALNCADIFFAIGCYGLFSIATKLLHRKRPWTQMEGRKADTTLGSTLPFVLQDAKSSERFREEIIPGHLLCHVWTSRIYTVTWTVKAVSSPCRAVPCRAEPSRAGPGRAAVCSLLHRVAVNTSRQRCHGDDSTVLSYYVTGRCWAIVP